MYFYVAFLIAAMKSLFLNINDGIIFVTTLIAPTSSSTTGWKLTDSSILVEVNVGTCNIGGLVLLLNANETIRSFFIQKVHFLDLKKKDQLVCICFLKMLNCYLC